MFKKFFGKDKEEKEIVENNENPEKKLGFF